VASELGEERDAEEVVRVGEEAHPGDDDGRQVVPLRLGAVNDGNIEFSRTKLYGPRHSVGPSI
jgi:hypothetical protein